MERKEGAPGPRMADLMAMMEHVRASEEGEENFSFTPEQVRNYHIGRQVAELFGPVAQRGHSLVVVLTSNEDASCSIGASELTPVLVMAALKGKELDSFLGAQVRAAIRGGQNVRPKGIFHEGRKSHE